MIQMRNIPFLFAAMTLLCSGCLTISGQRVTAQSDFFEIKVRPLLVSQCVSCHGATQQAGALRLDTKEGFSKGGSRGTLIATAKPADSLLLKTLSYHDKLKMPPAGKLRVDQIALISRWIETGANWSADKLKPALNSSSTHWAFQSIKRPPLPKVKNEAWCKNPIDWFILAKLEQNGLSPAPPARKRELIRRATFDLTGLPPTPKEVEQFVKSSDPKAYEALIDRLLASPRYGERWARYWLDVVRYADTNGYERDAEKPYSWKYRDYVIQSLNEDKPYDRFVKEQLAGDEMPDRIESTVTATGFLRLGTWDDEPNDALEYRYERLDDLVHATSAAFLGLTVRCARCHDHKFDPIPQKDYYAIAGAFYAGFIDAGDRELAGGPPQKALGFPVLGFTDKTRDAPPLHLLTAGDPRKESDIVEPGFLSLVTQSRRSVTPPPSNATTSTRRLQLAEWITDPKNPLPARVLVNRLWQRHFGRGIVSSPNNFGLKGDPPSHPELLDWLATEFVGDENIYPGMNADTHSSQNGWRIKKMHRMIMLSNTYRMASLHPLEKTYERKDALDILLWRFRRQRLDADALRDSILSVSGQLNETRGGRGFVPTLTREALEGLSRKGAEWNPSSLEDQRRRSIYLFLKRALIPPLMTAFDFGDTTAPLEQRDVTTVAPQALLLMNNPFILQQSEAFARRVESESGKEREKQVDRAWQLAFARSPSPKERVAAIAYLKVHSDKSSNPQPIYNETLPTAGLRLWLEADKGVTADSDGRVSQWADQSSNKFEAVQSLLAAQPTLVRNALNGLPVLRFNGKGQFLSLAYAVIPGQEFSIIAVASDKMGNGSHREIFSNWNGAAGNIGSAIFLGTTGASNVRFTDYFAPAGSLSRPEQVHILTAMTGSGGSIVYQNRNEIARVSSPLPMRNLMSPYVIGQQGNINGEFWNGDIAELLVYDHSLTEAERDQVWNYLDRRYHIAPRPAPIDSALISLCHVLFNANEFIYVD